MKTFNIGSILIALAMVIAAVLAVAARPTTNVRLAGSDFALERVIPEQFGDWRIDKSIVPIQPSPELLAVLKKTYEQTLSRTYINTQGWRIMLSIAYGGAETEGMQTHRPEICYPAQGFQVFNERVAQLATEYGTLPIKRLLAVQRNRSEPITYWLVVGEDRTRFGLGYKLTTVKYGLTGKIPDGMLVRVSSIDRDENVAYALQEDFIRSLLVALSEKDRVKIVGKFGA